MRTSAILKKGAASFEELKPACQVLILHEDLPAYARAAEACRRLMERFATELDFSIKCWNFVELADDNCARHAAKAAASADIILLSIRSAPLPEAIEEWMGDFLNDRGRADGALALVAQVSDVPTPKLSALAKRLEDLVSPSAMDFLLLSPNDDIGAIQSPPSSVGRSRVHP